jgi:hypothetical protein
VNERRHTSRERFVRRCRDLLFPVPFLYITPRKVVFLYPIAAILGCGLWKYGFFLCLKEVKMSKKAEKKRRMAKP